ncbi:S8 family peptidase [Bacillus sp. 165]|uniref:S8 family peptidase n=1 Tax=Bacillus sp. 165 TaxID=1529117 RepID=UPI001ADBBF85|nr:S8 family peptidase [Bacillus sp. 165]MBO9128143.1 S8 family peptidase [Bacillus sp. 165]
MSQTKHPIEKGTIRLIPYKVEQIVDETTEIPAGVALLQAPEVWDESEKGKGIVIAVLDTGCEPDHPDLVERIIDGYNFTSDHKSDVKNFADNNGHGTHVCGTIAASLNNAGVVGMAPEVKLLVLKVLQGDGAGSTKGIIDAIHYALDWRGPNGEKVRIISMSLGGPEDETALHEAVKRAVEENVLVVCAAGNEGDGDDQTVELSYPGSYREVVSVGAVSLDKKLARFSNTNQDIDVVGPGEKILSTYLNGKYAVLSGTSMATPHISGAAALIIKQCEKDFKRTLTEDEIYAQLVKRTVSLGYSKQAEGNGLLILTEGYGEIK